MNPAPFHLRDRGLRIWLLGAALLIPGCSDHRQNQRTSEPTTGSPAGRNHSAGGTTSPDHPVHKRHVILMIADGWGYKQIEAAKSYSGEAPPYEPFESVAMTTGSTDTMAALGGDLYDPQRFWSEFLYAKIAPTDSASSATAMYTGEKTKNRLLSVGPNGERLVSIGELALARGMGSGAVSSVPVTHATPAAWVAHNLDRGNYHVILDEALFGDPGATTNGAGGYGPTSPLTHVVVGGGNPQTNNGYCSIGQVDKAVYENDNPGGWTVALRDEGAPTGDSELQLLAQDYGTGRLLGLFGGPGGNINFRLHDGSGADPRDATLTEMATAALHVLERQPLGFVMMIEGGAVDWAGHLNDLSRNVGEMIGFNEAVAEVIRWIEDQTNDSNWDNTLLIVTGDHETGYLTAGPGVLPDVPLGVVTHSRILAEKQAIGGKRASWDDVNSDSVIDPGETVYWSWNTSGHTNSLIPCFFKGLGSETLEDAAIRNDPVRGEYMDNTEIFRAMLAVVESGRSR